MKQAKNGGIGERRDAALGAVLGAAVGNLAGAGNRRTLEERALDLAERSAASASALMRAEGPGLGDHRLHGTRFLAAAALAVVAASALGVPALAARRRALDAGFEAALAIMPEASFWVAETFMADPGPAGAVEEFVDGLWSPLDDEASAWSGTVGL